MPVERRHLRRQLRAEAAARLEHPGKEPAVARRLWSQQATAENGHRVAARLQRALVGGRVDPQRATGDDRHSGPRERVAEATRKAATAELLPTVHVDADYGAIGESVSDAHSTYTVAATVRVPLFAAGRAQARAAEADALVRQRRAELDDFRGRIDLEVRTALLDVRAAAQQIDAARTSVTLADQELEQARDRFSAGVASNIEVTQAQEAVAAASETYITALYAHNLAKASLARAVGIAEEAVTQFLGGQQ